MSGLCGSASQLSLVVDESVLSLLTFIIYTMDDFIGSNHCRAVVKLQQHKADACANQQAWLMCQFHVIIQACIWVILWQS